MALLSDFLYKFRKLHQDTVEKKATLSEKLTALVGFPIKADSVVVKNGVLTIKATPALKTEIFLKRQAILDALKGEGVVEMR